MKDDLDEAAKYVMLPGPHGSAKTMVKILLDRSQK